MTQQASVMPAFRYRAFISYSHQDKSWANWLHKALEAYRMPRRLVGMTTPAGVVPVRLAPIFRDRDELPSATDLNATVQEALEHSACLIVICSPHAARSRWVNQEIDAFKRLGRADRILCVLVGTEPAGEDDERELEHYFPPALRYRAEADGAPLEPIAADARRGADGKTNAKLKLIAGILGVGFDALAQREQQRHYRRLSIAAVAAALALALMAVFTTVAITSRREAERQRTHAENLVEFMLGDLTRKLQPEGRLNALDAVGKEALSYYAAQKPGELDAGALAHRARALHLIGQVYDLHGQLDGALAVFKQAADSTAELLARAPNDPQRIFDHAQSVYWVGYIAWQRGDFVPAEAAFHQYQLLAEHLVAIDPTKAAWQAEVEYAYSNLGTLLLDEGRAVEAATAFERSARIATTLAAKAPRDTAQQVDAAQADGWLADAFEEQGRFADAIGQRSAEVAICQSVLSGEPGNTGAIQSLVVARRALARLALAQGRGEEALTQSRGAAELADGLARVDVTNTFWSQLAADVHIDRGEVLHASGLDAMARDEVLHARRIAAALVAKNTTVMRWQVGLVARAELLRSALDADAGAHAQALATVKEVVRQLADVREKHPHDRAALDLLASADLLHGDELQALGRHSEAAQAWRAAVTLIDARAQPLSPKVRMTLAQVSLRLGDTEHARGIANDLARMGYRHPDMAKLEAQVASAESVGR